MRRLLPLLLVLPLTAACTDASTLDEYASEYPRYSGTTATSAEDGGSSASTPSPVWHHDAGAWEPDAAPVVTPTPVDPWSDAGSPVAPWSDDAGTVIAPSAPDSGASTTDDAGSSDDALLAACAGGINALRGQNDLRAYVVSTELETFAAQAAASDAQSGRFDGYFNENGGNDVSFAEDEFDGSQLDPGATAQQILTQGLLDEENGEIDNGENNLLSEQFGEVGCGVAQASDGSYWVTIEYR